MPDILILRSIKSVNDDHALLSKYTSEVNSFNTALTIMLKEIS